MKRFLPVLLVFILLVPAFIPAERAEEPGKWTIMIYMGGGFEQGINDAMKYDLEEMERAGYRDGFNVIVLKDGTAYGDSECLVLRKNGFEEVPLTEINASWGSELDMSDPHTLLSFADWALGSYDASHSMLVMWGHGRGWMGMPDDENDGVMSMQSLSLALKGISETHGDLDVVGFDQCNMAMFEVFYQIAPYAGYAVASEKEEDMAGWPYDVWLSHVYSMKNPDGRNVSMEVVRDYVSWAVNNSEYSATMSAVNLTHMDGVAGALQGYVHVLDSFLPYYKENITVARAEAESYDKSPYPFDLLNLTSSLDRCLDFPPLLAAGEHLSNEVRGSILLEKHHTVASDMSVEGATGMSIWFPTYGSRTDYDRLRVSYTGWPRFLDRYVSSFPPENRSGILLNSTLVDVNGDGALDSLSAKAYGNGTVHMDVFYNDELMKSMQGYGMCLMRFTGGPGRYALSAYVMKNDSIESYVTRTITLEKKLVIYGYINDFFGDPAQGHVTVSTGGKSFSADTNGDGTYVVELMAPYDYMPGERANISVCSGGSCTSGELWLNGTSVRMDFRMPYTIYWPSYASALLVFLIGAAGYVMLFDPERKERSMKRFKKPVKLKRIKKVIWVKDITDRQKELADLESALRFAEEGHGNTIFLTGEEGVGKRTLMEKLRGESGVKSVFYECRGGSGERPYEEILRIMGMLRDMKLISTDASEIFSKNSREMLMETAYDLIKEASSEEPLLIAIFNAQWMGESSLEVLEYIARGIDETRTLLVLSAPQEELEDRDGMPHPLNSMLMNLIIEGKVRMIKLERFDMETTGRMLSSIIGREVPEETLEKIYEMTRGLPEMISELAMKIRRSGMDVDDPDSLDLELPSTVKGLISRRVSHLDDPETRKIAEWGAVLGENFTYEDLKELSGIEGVDRHIYRLIEDKIITGEEGTYSFEHPEIRRHILEEIGERASEMHMKAGEMLERKGAEVYALAYQFCSAGNPEKCLEYSLKAASAAERSYAPKKAVEHYLDALKYADEDEMYSVFLALSENYYIIMDYENSLEYAKKVLYSEAPRELKDRARSIMGRAYLENSRWDEAREVYEELLKSEDPTMLIEGHRGLGKIYWRLGEHGRAMETIREAAGLADRLGKPLLSGSTRIDLANIYSDIGKYDDAVALYREAIEILEKAGELRELARAYNNLGEAYRYSGDMESAVESYLKSIDYADASGDINIKGYGLSNTGTVYAYMGRLEEAKYYLEKAYRIFRKKGSDFILSGIAMAYGIVYTKEKNWEMAEKKFLESIEALEEIDVKYDLGLSYLEYARMLGEKGDERCREMYARARELFESIGSEENVRKIDRELSGEVGNCPAR